MPLTLADLKQVNATLPPRICIYAPPGLGKTTLANEFPNAVFLQVEDGTPGDTSLVSFGQLSSYDQIIEGLSALYLEASARKTVVIDSLDKLEPLVWHKVCQMNNWKNIEDPGYGKGYVMADQYWQKILNGLNALRKDKDFNIVLLAHADITTFNSPTTASYSRFDIRLHKRALAMVQDEMDAILMINQDATIKTEELGFNKERAHAEGGGARWIYCEGRPSFVAKNRYGMPERVLYEKGKGYDALKSFFPGQAPRVPVAATPAPKAEKPALSAAEQFKADAPPQGPDITAAIARALPGNKPLPNGAEANAELGKGY